MRRIKAKQSKQEDKSAACCCIVTFLAIFGMIAHWVIFGY